MEFHQSSGVVQRAAELLREGPMATAELARRVLGLSGNQGAAASAVFALLGGDGRFHVDASGQWSLAAPRPLPPAASLRDERWVVVDVETTGGSPARGDRVTEVAAVVVQGGQIAEVFSTLVNPQRPIPSMITRITGITDEMVRGAPLFRDVADRLMEVLGGRVFVAHNASFDWRFVCSELERCGRAPDGRRLCTVKLARKLLPQLESRSLDGLAHYYGLEIEARHRAEDDAVATAEVLLRFIDTLEDQGVQAWDELEILLGSRKPKRKRTRAPRSMEQA